MTRRLSPEEVRTWRSFLRWSEGIVAQVAAELAAKSSLSVSDFEVAARLERDGGLLQGELAESLAWSPSRLSHQLKRMEQRGLVERVTAGRGRAVRVEMTARGRSEYTVAAQVHADAVRGSFLHNVRPEEAELIQRWGAQSSRSPQARPVEPEQESTT